MANYLSGHPGAALGNVESAEGTGYNAATCNIDLCSGYQVRIFFI